jgi:sugar O-acyltransferase (sialic acid O-acetyltransferase NeuD family)
MKMKKLIIFGTGDIAQIANYYFETDTDYEVVAFTVDSVYITNKRFQDKPVVAFEEIEKLYDPSKYIMFIATSYTKLNKIREAKYNEAKKKGYSLASYVSTRCSYMSQYVCGDNCFIFEDNTIQPFVKIGNNVTLWSGNHIGHHSTIADHNFISSHVVISGHCHIKSYCFLGVNATLHNNVIIEEENIIAAGAIISKTTGLQEIWVPAKSVRLNKRSIEIKF